MADRSREAQESPVGSMTEPEFELTAEQWNLIAHRRNRAKPKTQDGRKLRRYRKRWKVERSISWLQNFRRLVTRYEFHAHLFHGFAQLACMLVVLGRF